MSADKIKQIIAAAGGQAEIVAAVVAVYAIAHGVVHYVHTKVGG